MLAISLLSAAAMACVGFEPGKVTVLFGMLDFEKEFFTFEDGLRESLITSIVVDVFMDIILGQIGLILVIIATAGFFPAWMERGAIDVVVSKPVRRWQLFLGRYLGSMAFILFHATVFVILTFLVVGFRWGVWIPGYLLSIPLIVLLFSYLYCISVLVAVLFRSTVAAVLLTLFAWVGFTGVQSLDDAFTMFPEWQKYRTVYQSVHLARWVVPKTQDILYNARKWSGAAEATALMPEPQEEDRELVKGAGKVEAARMAISPVYTIGSSLLFEAAVLILAMWRFSRRDY
jgi:ABC-type transport system involved in multi-copper enzyme maturation permease subunit